MPGTSNDSRRQTVSSDHDGEDAAVEELEQPLVSRLIDDLRREGGEVSFGDGR